MSSSDEERPMNHFFDDDSEYGEMLNRDAWLRGETDSDLEREGDEMEKYAEAIEYESDDYSDNHDLPQDARDLPAGFPTSLLEEPYRAPLSPSFLVSILERMERRNRARQALHRSKSSSTEIDPEDECDPEADADNEVSDGAALSPETEIQEKASSPDRQVKSTRKLRQERNLVPKKWLSK
ncbi:hypothetical protein FA13DRAFT_1813732 [Coprinellus micaceus]|uniref:Uncharacterized protein n=1 Tax=Coprinellus micaceus TaxID=71717 RepID=A0A4Y7TCR1_COPMI|nr:hypothetical protein FA13DRAFT_1813732 [Coprinellus micaceus]